MSKSHNVGAVLLTGGLSSRMGKDKASLHPYGECKPNLLNRTHGILSNYFNQIWVSCAKGKAREGYNCIFDTYKEIGPIAGIYAGLNMAKEAGLEAILVLPCDLPLLDGQIIELLLKARTNHMEASGCNLMTTFLHEQTGNIEALVSIYEVNALPLFAKAITEGIGAPRLVVLEDKRTTIPFTPEVAQALYNLNTAKEYEEFTKKYNFRD